MDVWTLREAAKDASDVRRVYFKIRREVWLNFIPLFQISLVTAIATTILMQLHYTLYVFLSSPGNQTAVYNPGGISNRKVTKLGLYS